LSVSLSLLIVVAVAVAVAVVIVVVVIVIIMFVAIFQPRPFVAATSVQSISDDFNSRPWYV
jgi:hypothetical protein